LKDVNGRNITTEEREAAKMNKNTVDVLKRGVGDAQDINYAFAALATASGFEARVAKLSDRGSFLFDPAMRSAFFLNS
jgi:transglutaminase-like putative cysteine protease